VLSRCSEAATRKFIAAVCLANQMFDALVPPEFQGRMSAPAAFILYGEDMQAAIPQAILDSMGAKTGKRVGIAPNFMLFDRDEIKTVALFRDSQAILQRNPESIPFLLGTRTPSPPAWFIAGLRDLFLTATYLTDAVQFGPQEWTSPGTTAAIRSDPESPRRLIPLLELFANDRPNGDPESEAARHAEAQLFLRWALAPEVPERRAQLWKFISATAADPSAGEPLFERCFGMGYSEALDQLDDALPSALQARLTVGLGHLPGLLEFDVRLATGVEVARINGDWERLESNYVRTRIPQAVENYVGQVKLTMSEVGQRERGDSALRAVLGLCAIDAGDPTAARGDLEAAAAASVVRPRVYVELARLRFAEAAKMPAGPGGTLSAQQGEGIASVLRAGRLQEPQLLESYLILAELWTRCKAPIPSADLEGLHAGARLFPSNLKLLRLTESACTVHGLHEPGQKPRVLDQE
jgi:hypothetical protein